jgi:HSP20 family protein
MDDRRYAMTVSLRPVMEVREPSLLRREHEFLTGFERGMDSLFDQIFEPSLVTYMVPETRGVFSPRIDIKETKKEYKIVSELPGLDQKDIDVSVREGMLTITGEKREEKEETEGDYYHVERMFGRFSRCVTLPDSVDMDHVKSVFKNGLLTITLPKNEKMIVKPKKIPVTTS